MYLIIVVGMTGQGKSVWVNEFLRNTARIEGGRVLNYPTRNSLKQYVFDINNEYMFPDDSTIKPIMRNVTLSQASFFETCKHLRNYNIVFEDATGFLRGAQSRDFIRMIQAKRHTGNNWILLFHSLVRVPPELMEFSNYLVLHKTGDNENRVRQKFDSDELTAKFLEVQKMPPSKYPQISRLVLTKFVDY